MRVSHPDVVEFIHAKNKDVSLAHTLRLNDPDDYTYTTFSEALRRPANSSTRTAACPSTSGTPSRATL